MDRRQTKTRAAIFGALTDLLSRKKYSSISVQDIIDEANIGRSTFYSHFETKDMLLREMCDEIFGHIFSEHPQQCGVYVSATGTDRLEDRLAHILYHIRESKYRVSEIISSDSGEVFLSYFKEYMKEIFAGYLPEGKPEIPAAYLTDFYASAFSETVRWWLASAGSCTPETAASYFTKAAGLDRGLSNNT